MTVPPVVSSGTPRHILTLVATLLGVFTPAIYAASWAPWLRWALTACLGVILVLVVYVVRAVVVGGVLVGPVAIVAPFM